MITLLRKLRRHVLENRKFSNYLLYAAGEIILVVIGILIALQINSRYNKGLERREAEQVYAAIRQQVSEDRAELVRVLEYNRFFLGAYERANAIISSGDRSKADSVALMAMMLSQYSDFPRNASLYENLAASGKLNLLQNSGITGELQKLEMTYNLANKLENLHWDVIIHELSPELRSVVDYNTTKAVLPDRLYGVELQNIFVESIYMSHVKDSVYRRALVEIDTLVRRINREIAE